MADHDAILAGDGAFNLARTSAVLHHAPDLAMTLHELCRVVRPGGMVTILDADLAGSFPILPWLPEMEGRLHAAALAAHLANYDSHLPYRFAAYIGRELPQQFREAGLADSEIWPVVEIDRGPLTSHRSAQSRD